MTAYSIVRLRVKPGRDQEFIDRLRQALSASPPEGLREAVVIRLGGNLYCCLLEWESYDAIADGRAASRAVVDAFRDLLEDLGDVGVTYAVSGDAVHESSRPEGTIRRGLEARPAAWNVLRYSLVRGSESVVEKIARAASPPDEPLAPGLRRVATVKVGARAFCLLGEWDSLDDLAMGGPATIRRLEVFRDALESMPGGLGVIQASSGPTVFEWPDKG